MTRFLSIALFAALVAGPVALKAQPSIASIQGSFLDAQNYLQMAATDFQTAITNSGDQSATIADLDSAVSTLDTISGDITNSSIQSALGKKYKSVEKAVSAKIVLANKKLQAALSAVNDISGRTETAYRPDDVIGPVTFSQRKAVIVAFAGAASDILSGGLLLGKPLIANKSPSTAGFYSPKAVASFQIDSAGCDEAPVVTVQNAGPFNSPIDTSTVVYDTATGVVSFKMGTDAGGGSVTVSACGQTSTLLIYNYGTTPVAGVPLDFPQTLPTGEYVMTYSASGSANIEPTQIGIFKMTSLKTFYNIITKTFSAAISSVSSPDCSQGVSYSPYTDDSFSVSYTVTCSSGGESASETLNFTLTKQ